MQKQRHHSIRRFSIGMWTVCIVLLLPILVYAAFNVGSILVQSGSIKFKGERGVPTGGDAAAVGSAVMYNDSTSHKLKLNNNNTGYANILTDAAAGIPDSALSANVAFLNVNSQRFGVALTTFGAGTTGTNLGEVRIDGGSGANGDTWLEVARNTVTKARFGVSGGANRFITGDAADDLSITSVQKINFSADSGTTLHLQLTAAQLKNLTGRIVTSGSTPTTSVAAGFCTTPSVAVDTGSGDEAGIITITTGTGCAAATGSVTVTFSTTNGAFGTNTPSVTVMPFDGAAAWDTGVTWKTTAQSTTAFTVAFKNGATNFTSSTTYKFNYHVWGK